MEVIAYALDQSAYMSNYRYKLRYKRCKKTLEFSES